jgi:ABC-type lipoprotein export system ATPase subunit
VQELPGQPAWRERALALLDEVGIADLAERRPAEVSGGQLQRAAIARALLRDPALILADEPTGNLDPENAERVLELLLAQARGDRALVLVTHNEALAQRCQRAVRMVQGRLA